MTDVQMFLAGLNLAYTDRASMAAATEVRVPYVDLEVAKAAFTFSAHDKIHGRERKAILKKAAEGALPKAIIYRPKGLFSAPLRAWVRRDLAEMVDDVLPDGQLVRLGMINRAAVERMIREDRAGAADRSKEIWHLLTLEEWIRQTAAVPAADTVRTT
jgi:asparagine synthase (glutamine-hydrolysing)